MIVVSFDSFVDNLYPLFFVVQQLTKMVKTHIQSLIGCDDDVLSEFCWPLKDKCSNILVGEKKYPEITFTGNGITARLIQTANPFPPNIPYLYFEVEIIFAGDEGMIGIGITPSSKPNKRQSCLPGWDSQGIAYQGQYGRIYCNSDAAVDQTDTYTTGDIVGCYCYRSKVDAMDRIFVQFTKNGSVLDPIQCIEGQEYYPTVGSASNGSIIEFNFGQKPFKCDIRGK